MGATVYPLTTMPELPEVEITARRLDEALRGQVIESVRTPGINVLKTFDPPPSALAGRTFEGARRRGKNLLFPTADGELVRDALLWNDNRSAGEARDLIHDLGGAQAWADAVGAVHR